MTCLKYRNIETPNTKHAPCHAVMLLSLPFSCTSVHTPPGTWYILLYRHPYILTFFYCSVPDPCQEHITAGILLYESSTPTSTTTVAVVVQQRECEYMLMSPRSLCVSYSPTLLPACARCTYLHILHMIPPTRRRRRERAKGRLSPLEMYGPGDGGGRGGAGSRGRGGGNFEGRRDDRWVHPSANYWLTR